MANKKNFWYVLVCTNEGPKFVTKINYIDKTAEWNVAEKPLEMSKSTAQDLAMGLSLNFHMAYAVCQSWQIDTHPFLYDRGHFEWVYNENKEEQ